jgi:hypothetical protein
VWGAIDFALVSVLSCEERRDVSRFDSDRRSTTRRRARFEESGCRPGLVALLFRRQGESGPDWDGVARALPFHGGVGSPSGRARQATVRSQLGGCSGYRAGVTFGVLL